MGVVWSLLYNVFEYVMNAVLFWRHNELQVLIKDVGLDLSKWTKILRDVFRVNDLSQLKAFTQNEENIQRVIEYADDYEICGLHELLDISEPQPIAEPENKLSLRLKELGLDERHWFNKLNSKYAVVNLNSIKHIGLDCLNELQQVCQTRIEMIKLRNLLDIDNDYYSFVVHFSKVKNRIKLVLEFTKQIKSLISNGRTRSCKNVQTKEDSLREMLQISSVNWIRPTMSLDIVLNDLSKLSCCLEVNIPTQDMPPSYLIQSASCGVCLKGILYTENTNYLLPAECPVLKVPKKVVLDLPNLPESEIVISGDEDSVESFIKHTHNYGYVSGYVNLPLSRSSDGISTVKMKQVPIASFTFRRKELRFDDNALQHLKRIDAMIEHEETRARESCKEFLNIYGSHIFQGPFHFGGIHWITVKCKNIVVESKIEIQAIHLDSIKAIENAPFGKFSLNYEYNADKVKEKLRSKYTKHNLKYIVIKATTSGGMGTYSYLPTWKIGMSADISSWIVTNRETALRVAIWDIVKENYSSEFENASKMGYFLYKAWVDVSNVHHTFPISNVLQALMAEAHKYVEFSEDAHVVDRQCTVLTKLLEIKKKVIKDTKSIKAWSDIFLESKTLNMPKLIKGLLKFPNPRILAMGCKIITYNDILDQQWVLNDETNVYFELRRLLEQGLLESSGGNSHDISEFIDFTFLLEQAVLDFEVDGQNQHSPPNVSAYLSTAVIRLFDVLQRQNRLSDAKLILALTAPLGFDTTTGFLHTKLTIQGLTSLAATIENNISTYKNLNYTKQKSVFIFYNYLKMISLNDDGYNLQHKLQKSTFYQELPGEIRNRIDDLSEDSKNWRKIELYLCQCYTKPTDLDLKPPIVLNISPDCDKDGSEISLNISDTTKHCCDIIKKMNLEKYFPRKITRQKALIVSRNMISCDDLQNCSNIPWYMLQNLMMCNYNGLSIQNNPNISDEETISAQLNAQTAGHSALNSINPADALVALLMCADDFLRQLIMEKLTMCQFSIPLFLPMSVDGSLRFEMLLWATRTIKKQWKTRSGSACERLMSMQPMPIVSAMRIGKLHISKSKILNVVINDNKHDIFFNCGCNGGTLDRTLSIGILEIAWYLPNGKDQDKFSEAITIMNLRGNASYFKRQSDFLKEVSLAIIAFISSDILDKSETDILESLFKQDINLLLVLESIPNEQMKELLCSWQQLYSRKVRLITTVGKNDSQVSGQITSTINRMISKGYCGAPDKQLSIDDCSDVARNIGFHVDEDINECVSAKAAAKEMTTSIEFSTGNSEQRKKMLPLQIISIEIAKKRREEFQQKERGNMVIGKYISKMQSDTKVLRFEQKRFHEDGSTWMKIFLDSFSYTLLRRKYFNCWVKIFSDQSSISRMHPVREEHKTKWIQLCNVVQTAQNKQEIKSLKDELDKLQKKLTSLSVGLEHFNREIAQMYEMTMYLKTLDSFSSHPVKHLPVVAAEMLLEGHPLELMDGDASYIPIVWIKDVMLCLQQKIGHKRVFVLSVLGLQSSGKSTMLNVLFGLQFAVGAGRVTKGVFSQLVQLEPDLIELTHCDYILVVDTEGLRAPELASIISDPVRDNEIATFVIGLGDATIINIMGENTSHMQDILQIAVTALMKMESVNLKPSCLFVHQNVSDTTASDKNIGQKRKMTEMLDEITKLSAKLNNCSEKFQVFSDVINFQENKHVVNISSLWQGDPPMAPLNPGYSSSLLQVKKKVIDLMKNCDSLTLSVLHKKLADLWWAVLTENFVFSFKNVQQMKAYNDLERVYVEHSRTLRRNTMDCQDELRNECNKLKHSSVYQEYKDILDKHLTTLDNAIELFKKKIDKYFKDNPRALDWKTKTELRLQGLYKDLRNSLKNELEAIKNKIDGRAKIDSKIKSHEKEIQKKAKELADFCRGAGITKETLKTVFDEHWIKWVSVIPDQYNPVIIQSTLENIFQDHFSDAKLDTVIKILTSNSYKQEVKSSDITKLKAADHVPYLGYSTDTFIDSARVHINSIKLASIKKIRSFEENGNLFTKEILIEMVEFVAKQLNDVTKKERYVFSDKGLIRITISIMWSLMGNLNEFQEACRKEADLKLYMEREKNRLWEMFRDESTIANLNVSVSYAVSRELVNAIGYSLKERCIKGLIDKSRTCPTFANKMSYHAQLLIDLKEKNEGFYAFRSYLTNPFHCMENSIAENLRKLCRTKATKNETVVQCIHFEKVTELFNLARTAIHKTCRGLEATCSMSIWWPKLLEHIDNAFYVKAETCFFSSDRIFNVEEMNANLLNELNRSETGMKKAFSMDFTNEIIEPCSEFLKKDILGCPELCPFCKAPCDFVLDVIDKTDEHRTHCHRPKGVSGYYEENTGKLSATVCTTSVMGDGTFKNIDTNGEPHPYKEYQSVNAYYKTWKIQPEPTESQLYWKWFMATYNDELAKYYECKPADIPDEWKITWEAAKENMIETYNL